MIPKDTIFSSMEGPALAIFDGITYVVPGWHIVPTGTTIEEVYKHWKKIRYGKIEQKPKSPINEIVISQKTGEKYTVNFDGKYWSCTCMGFGFRGRCKHIEQTKIKH